MDGRNRTWPRLAAALVIAIGVATVWATLLLWMGYFATQFWQTERVYETIDVLRDGTPVIQSRSGSNWLDVSYRTLDGRPIAVDEERTLQGTGFQSPIKPPGLYETTVPWSMRIAGLSDFQRPPVAWYVVRDEQPLGHAYFVGYDQLSKLRVGYISRSGFSRAMPGSDQWFDIGRHQLGWGSGVITSTSQINFGSSANAYSVSVEDRRMPPWNAYLIDGDRLLEIDLRARSLRPLYESPGLLASAILCEEPAPAAGAAAATAAAPAAAQSPAPNTTPVAGEAAKPGELQPRVAVRTAERIVVLDPSTGSKREFPLPEPLRAANLVTYALPSGELLAIWRKDNDPSRNENRLAWIRPDGSIAREKEVSLAGYEQPPERVAFWLAVPAVPIPAGWAAVLSLIVPLSMVQTNQAASYSDALTQGFGFGGLPFVAVVLIGALLAWLTLRLQRKYRRLATGVWCAFVFLFGLPGFIAYWLEHHRPNLEACQECGQLVPRDRDACAACNTPFAPPPPVGTEIFA